MAYTATWDETVPAGTEARSLGDDRIRELKVQIRERMESAGVVSWSADPVVGPVPAGSKMLFYQDTAPSGWTIVNSLDDKLVYITKGSLAGGQTGGGVHSSGSWTLSGLSAYGHTHSRATHTHGNNQTGALDGSTLGIYGAGAYYLPYGINMPTSAAGGGGATGKGATSGAISLTFAASSKKITRASGSFVTDGFMIGSVITSDAVLNPGPFTIVTVVALEIVVSETLVDEGPVTKTLSGDGVSVKSTGLWRPAAYCCIVASKN